jgi:long-subunit fatty acid transport protein
MWDYRKTFVALCWVMGYSLTAAGQAAKTPFSSFALGEYYGNALAHNQGMAGVAISNPQIYYLNNVNPALLVFNYYTVFEGGVIGERRTVSSGGLSEKNSNMNLNYLALGFPVMRGKWAAAFGLMPYSNVNYQFQYTEPIIGSTNTVQVQETGSGGINQFYFSNGFRLNRKFSVGLKTSYLFGPITTTYRNTLTTTDQTIPFTPSVTEENAVKDINFTAGFSYHADTVFQKPLRFNVGLIYDFRTKLNTRYTAILEQANIGGVQGTDTLFVDVPSSVTLPQSIGIGASIGKSDRWMVGMDLMYLDFSNFRNFQGRTTQTEAGYRLAVGGEVTPDPNAIGSFLKRITYRTGVSLEKYPYLVNGSQVRDFGINFGLSLPVNRSSVDLGARVGRRGSLADNLIKEDYFKIYFGVTFNDQWFIKRKFD